MTPEGLLDLIAVTSLAALALAVVAARRRAWFMSVVSASIGAIGLLVFLGGPQA